MHGNAGADRFWRKFPDHCDRSCERHDVLLLGQGHKHLRRQRRVDDVDCRCSGPARRHPGQQVGRALVERLPVVGARPDYRLRDRVPPLRRRHMAERQDQGNHRHHLHGDRSDQRSRLRIPRCRKECRLDGVLSDGWTGDPSCGSGQAAIGEGHSAQWQD